MMEKGKLERGVVDTESLVPQEHLLVFIDGTQGQRECKQENQARGSRCGSAVQG